jgi:SPP1 gp7 family putative phage head morphogenesis protein
MIVELNGVDLKTARRCAHRMIERTSAVKSTDAPTPRSYALSKRAHKLERARMRVKVLGTKKLRTELLGVLEDWRGAVVAAVRKSAVREADVSGLDADLSAAVSAGILTDDQRAAIIAAVNAALQSMDPKALANVITQVQQELFEAGLESGAGEVGLTWNVPPTMALQAFSQDVIPFSQAIVDRERAAIQAALLDGIEAGEGIAQLADRIQDTFEDGMHVLDDSGQVTRVIPNDSWAEMVARTETSRAMNAGIMGAYRAAGVARVMWVAAEDERTCPECDAADGEIVLLEQDFPDVDVSAPPAHPSCCPPGTMVLTKRGEIAIEKVRVGDLVWTHRGRWRAVTGLMQRTVAEMLWTVRAGHRVLRITGNHPVLTDDGWTVAAALQPTNQVYRVDAEAVLRSSSESNDAPPQRDKRGFLGLVLGAFTRRRMPASAVDLDCQKPVGNRDVDHKLSDGVVEHGLDSTRDESFVNDRLIDGKRASLLSRGLTCEPSFAHLAASSRVVRRPRQGDSLRSGRSAHSDGHRLTPIALLEPESGETGGDRRPGNLMARSERFERLAGEVLLVDFPTPFVSQPPSHTAIVPIDSIACLNYAGVVHNFEVEEDESYVAGGIVVHNCRCTIVSAGYAEADEAAGEEDLAA